MKIHNEAQQINMPLWGVGNNQEPWLILVMLIGGAAGGPDNGAQEDSDEAANHEKNHGRSPC